MMKMKKTLLNKYYKDSLTNERILNCEEGYRCIEITINLENASNDWYENFENIFTGSGVDMHLYDGSYDVDGFVVAVLEEDIETFNKIWKEVKNELAKELEKEEENNITTREKICDQLMYWELEQNDDGSVEVKGYKPQHNQSNQFYRYFVEVATDEFIDTIKFMADDNIKYHDVETFLYMIWEEIIKDRSILDKIYVHRQFNKYYDYMAKVEEIKKEDISIYGYDSTHIAYLTESEFEKIRDNERQNIYCFLYGKKGEDVSLIGHL